MAFNGPKILFPSIAVTREDSIGKRKLKWLPINDGKTILAIVPFLGGHYGLSSDVQLHDFG